MDSPERQFEDSWSTNVDSLLVRFTYRLGVDFLSSMKVESLSIGLLAFTVFQCFEFGVQVRNQFVKHFRKLRVS